MKKIILLITIISITFYSCSKESKKPSSGSKRITYTFSPGIGGAAQITLYSNREGKHISTQQSSLYSYQDEVKIGDKVTLVMKKTGEIRGNFDIRVSMGDKSVFSSSSIEAGAYPSVIVIDKILDKSHFD